MRAPSTQRQVGDSVTRSWHSVWVRSRTSSSPRCVGLAPTTTAPTSAAASSQKTNSGDVVEQHGDVERAVDPPRPAARRPAGPPGPPPRRGSAAGRRPRGRDRWSSARASTARAIVSATGRRADIGPSGGASAGVTASPNVSDLGWKAHYWNTLHFSPSRVTVAGAPAERTAATLREDGQPHGIRDLQRRVRAAQVRRAARCVGRTRPHHGRGRLHRGGRQGGLQVHLGLRAPLPDRRTRTSRPPSPSWPSAPPRPTTSTSARASSTSRRR